MVAGTLIIRAVDAQSNILGLLIQMNKNDSGIGFEPISGIGVANSANGVARDALDIHIAIGGDLAHHQEQPGRRGHLTSHPRPRILSEDGVQDGIGDLVADFVRVAFRD